MGRKKLSENRKRKQISTTVNPKLYEIYEKYIEETGMMKSDVIEKFLKSALQDEDMLNKLLNEDILIDNKLLKNKNE